MKSTKLLSRREYHTKNWTIQDLIIEAVNREELQFIKEGPREIKPDFRPHKAQWSQAVKHVFGSNVKSYLP